MTPQDVSRDLFERRMRQRRAATCVTAARASLESGRTLEAVERLEEACRLDPEALEARLLLEQIRADEPADLTELVPEEPREEAAGFGKWSHWVAAVIAVGALAALALLRQPGSDESRAAPARERARPAVTTEAPAAAQADLGAGESKPSASPNTVPLVIQRADPSIVASAEPGGTGDRGGEPVGTGGATATSEPGARDAVPLSRRLSMGSDTGTQGAPAPAAGAAAPGTRPAETASASVPPALPPPVERSAVTGAGGEPPQGAGDTKILAVAAPPGGSTAAGPPAAQTPAAMSSTTTTVPPVPASNPLPPPAAEDAARRGVTPGPRPTDPAPASYRAPRDEEEIGRTLQLYADAYERLDAAAARKVWPTVDERALARAFAGLESQGISFDRCETEVEGSEARAVCTGRAQYVPKVGSREPLTASRQWNFRLRRAGEGWQIASAEVR